MENKSVTKEENLNENTPNEDLSKRRGNLDLAEVKPKQSKIVVVEYNYRNTFVKRIKSLSRSRMVSGLDFGRVGFEHFGIGL